MCSGNDQIVGKDRGDQRDAESQRHGGEDMRTHRSVDKTDKAVKRNEEVREKEKDKKG